ncbi:hypothetical protein DFJ73DRAFT_855782 [Zopfochytrium polystomum]|nr:hypothetical protein DFJ73DRAFT_855782 [Zopfochytrium polystomum]
MTAPSFAVELILSPNAAHDALASSPQYLAAHPLSTNVFNTALDYALRTSDASKSPAENGPDRIPPTVWILVRAYAADQQPSTPSSPTAGRVVGAAFHSGTGYPPNLCPMPPGAAAAVADRLFDAVRYQTPGILGPIKGATGHPAAAAEFASRWCDLHRAEVSSRGSTSALSLVPRKVKGLVVYVMTSPPAAVPHPRGGGRLRPPANLSTTDDLPWLVTSVRAFQDELHLPAVRDDILAAGFERSIAERRVAVWEDDAGKPVGMAVHRAPAGVARISRIGPVYTPPEERRKGFAAAVVASCARMAFADGGAAVVMLFADDADAGANALYTGAGFKRDEEGDSVEIEFVTE